MANLLVRAYTPEGKPLPKGGFWSFYLTDLERNPIRRTPQEVQDGILALKPPPKGPFVITMHLPVEGFGTVWLYADNNGKGYTERDKEINLNLEFASSRLFAVSEARNRYLRQGSIFSKSVKERLDKAKRALKEAENAFKSGELARGAAFSQQSLCESLWAGELVVLEKAKQDIVKRGPRKGFLFGCNFFGYPGQGEKYAELFAGLFNFATLPFYWRSFEPQEGRPQYERIDVMLKRLKQSKIVAKGHPLMWFHEAGVPEWLKGRSYEEVSQLARKRIREIVSRYRGKIDIWDVINEAHDWANILDYSQEQLLEMTRLASEETKAANPKAIRIVNNCSPWGEYVVDSRDYQGPAGRPTRTPIEYLKACLREEVDFDVVGVQVYYPAQDMFEIDGLLERYSKFGKPIHITELGVSSGTEPDERAHIKYPSGSYWHAAWSEEVQADWIEQFYTLCYSKPYIEAITWWDFSDAGGHFMPHSGFVRPDLTPKVSYERLKGLISTWQRG